MNIRNLICITIVSEKVYVLECWQAYVHVFNSYSIFSMREVHPSNAHPIFDEIDHYLNRLTSRTCKIGA